MVYFYFRKDFVDLNRGMACNCVGSSSLRIRLIFSYMCGVTRGWRTWRGKGVQNVCTKRISALAALDKWCNITKQTQRERER